MAPTSSAPQIVPTPVVSLQAVYVMWLREMLRTIRAPSRVIGSLVMPLLLLGFLGSGMRGSVLGVPNEGGYLTYLAPGMMGMTLLFGSVFSGLHVLWDRQFGFLREIMVTPVSRLSILLGRIAGGMTMALTQGILVGVGALVLGVDFRISPFGLLQALLAMVLISVSFVSLGLIFATLMKDFQGFSLVMNFIIMPIFFLSGALFPIENLPAWLQPVCYMDPLAYGVDLLRGALTDNAAISPALAWAALSGFAATGVGVGSMLFGRLEVN